MKTTELFAWIKERHSIWKKRNAGLPKPWTQDKILQSYRFCNTYRELDTVTVWIAKNWRLPFKDDKYLWFAMTVARLLNWPETLAELGCPVQWNPDRFIRVVHDRRDRKLKAFSGAYIVSTNGFAMDKAEYLAQHVLGPLWDDRKEIAAAYSRPLTAPRLADFHKVLMQYDGLGSFIAAQVVADCKYVGPLQKAEDWFTWAASGPGSRRGLNRVYEKDVAAPWTEANWLARLQELHRDINKLIKKNDMPTLHAQDLQNCLCEFDKYERTRLGEGKPRSTYPGGK